WRPFAKPSHRANEHSYRRQQPMPSNFSTALAGLNAHAAGIDVVGNNLANLNTIGFKPSTVAFRDLVSQSLGAGSTSTETGFGTAPPKVVRQFVQGPIQSSGGPLDAAIQGDGFFIIRNNQGGLLYTRAGNFQVDANGFLITATKERV